MGEWGNKGADVEVGGQGRGKRSVTGRAREERKKKGRRAGHPRTPGRGGGARAGRAEGGNKRPWATGAGAVAGASGRAGHGGSRAAEKGGPPGEPKKWDMSGPGHTQGRRQWRVAPDDTERKSGRGGLARQARAQQTRERGREGEGPREGTRGAPESETKRGE
ncbi:cuticle collagen 39-like [Dendrobium catenatum]|uniref:cuticle collagen 39-like n=1 Tax=Dendrobium catenatum TaxID=906689 RepID=UPI00109FB82C|nr:cuticle collagen 39-like [Dendrobium catenatum]